MSQAGPEAPASSCMRELHPVPDSLRSFSRMDHILKIITNFGASDSGVENGEPQEACLLENMRAFNQK